MGPSKAVEKPGKTGADNRIGLDHRQVARYFSAARYVGLPGPLFPAQAPAFTEDTIRRPLLCLALPFLAACGSEAPPPEEDAPPARDTEETPPSFQPRVYERYLLFLAGTPEADLAVVWSFRTRTRSEGVDREARGWLARGEEWDAFHRERWEGPPTRAPWRILPRGPLRLVVGEGDALERLIYDEGPRFLELEPGPELVTWSSQQGETLRVQEGDLVFSEREIPGVVLDAARVWPGQGPAPGDWAFLVSGDSVHLVLEQAARDETRSPASPADSMAFQAWGRLDQGDTRWPQVAVTWTETRAFERARRDVPVAWEITSGDGELQGTLQVETAFLEAGEGEGPILPVEGLYQVAGSLRILGRDYPVRGLYHHVRR